MAVGDHGGGPGRRPQQGTGAGGTPRSLRLSDGLLSGYFAITNPRLGFGVGLRWPLEVFDKAWLWQEVGWGRDWPWFGQAYVVAVEPASTVPGQGMAMARAKGAAYAHLGPRASQEVVIEAVLFEGSQPVLGIAEGGAVSFSAS